MSHPFTGKRSVPAYYRPARANPRINPDADVSDVLHAWPVLLYDHAEAVVKILRLGRKPGTDYVQECRKIAEHAVRALEFAELDAAEHGGPGDLVEVKVRHSLSQMER